MFYEHTFLKRQASSDTKLESAIVVLTSAESKRLIAKAVATLPEVTAVLQNGTLVITRGSTNALIAEEILGRTIGYKGDFVSGVICRGELNASRGDIKMSPFVLRDGKFSEIHARVALRDFKPGDVFIKGANAVDVRGDIGILVAAQTGSMTNDAWFGVTGRGADFICPVGLEKLVLSVSEAARKCCMFRFKYSMGLPCSLIPFSNAKVVTEVQAIQVLSGANAIHVASGGIDGSEGAVTLVLEGEASILEQAFELVKSVKGEPLLSPPRQYSNPPAASLEYDPHRLSETVQDQTKRP